MSDFRFANPDWSAAVWVVALVVALLLWLDWRRGDVLARFLSPLMQARLAYRLSAARRWLSIALAGVAAVCMVVALMRPQWGLTYHKMPRVGAQIMVCLDVSKSMLAEDTAPNRLERAKAELTDLLSYLEGDQVGLIAFAGTASVLCPMTPDFGFFKLVLDGTGPHSVGRGGTRLEEPIRKALEGFRSESDLSRVVLLITDGEDHDSHPLDAAKAAAERGVKVLAIGFGDEAGSEIHITDPQTGVRSVLRDSAGQTVISRLDGDTLRDMALATEGAYIPAGTGALDLQSIYDVHIAPLVRGKLDDRGRAVRREGFQWAVLSALLLLVTSVAVGGGSARSEMAGKPNLPLRPSRARIPAAVLIALAGAIGSSAQESPPNGETLPRVTADGVEEAQVAPPQVERRATDQFEQKPPRELYNEALPLLESDLDGAERLLTEARRQSGTDGEVRFRAAYNLAWVEIKRADRQLDENPQAALEHLRRGADWFRDAVRLRPESEDARYNLEIVLRRILELADSLSGAEDTDLTRRLEELIETERALVAATGEIVQRVAEAGANPAAPDEFRDAFRQLAVRQRQALSDCQAISKSAREETDAIAGKSAEEQTAEEKLRAAQLSGLLHYTGRAEQRLGQSRSQMRMRQDERAFRRAAAALDELKRARDQLRGPVEILDVIIADATSLLRLTSGKAAGDVPSVPGAQSQSPPAPAWLTTEYLEEGQIAITERTTELTARLEAGLQQETKPGDTDEDGNHASPEGMSAEGERFLEMVRRAVPFLTTGREKFEAAGQALTAEQFDRAGQNQVEAIAALRDARERFLDLRGLVELGHARQTEVQAWLISSVETADSADTKADEKPAASSGERADDRPLSPRDRLLATQVSQRIQQENVDRSGRIEELIDQQLAALPQPAASTDQEPPEPDDDQAERQRLELASLFLASARDEMVAAGETLAEALSSPPEEAAGESEQAGSKDEGDDKTKAVESAIDGATLSRAKDHAEKALEHWQSLRRLFFTLPEHLRETAQRQAQLNDETEQLATLAGDEDPSKEAGPFALRQEELQKVSQEISEALREQAAVPPAGTGTEQGIDPEQLQQLQQVAEQYGKAAKMVEDAATEMEGAGESLSAEPPQLKTARESQDKALEKLAEALAMLQPPRQDQQDQQGQQQQQQQEGQAGQQEQQDQARQQSFDPSRLLQAIRDREAQRRNDRQERQRLRQEPVEKDW